MGEYMRNKWLWIFIHNLYLILRVQRSEYNYVCNHDDSNCTTYFFPIGVKGYPNRGEELALNSPRRPISGEQRIIDKYFIQRNNIKIFHTQSTI
jgi:hypothetical protein